MATRRREPQRGYTRAVEEQQAKRATPVQGMSFAGGMAQPAQRMMGQAAPGVQAAGDPRRQLMQQLAMGGARAGATGQAPMMAGAAKRTPMMGGGDARERLQAMAQRRRMGMGAEPMRGVDSPRPTMGTVLGKDDPVRMGQVAQVDSQRVKEAMRTLMEYKSAKATTDQRIIKAQEWWRQRNWDQIFRDRGVIGTQPHKTSTGWLKTAVITAHADYMEAYPEPLFLARNQEDEAEAAHLSEIIPVILNQINFEETYSDVGWQKLTEGTGIYGVTWDGQAQHGMGEISVVKINALNFYAEPGIEDVQDSANVFCVRMEDNRRLEAMYPELQGKLSGPEMQPNSYEPLDEQDHGNKSLVVDWYYKKHNGQKEVLHYCKFVGENVLYASENDQSMQQSGYYAHGLYPFIVDPLLPDAETIYGQGLIDEGKGAQTDIDTMSQAMVTNAVANATPRYFMRQDGGVNADQFLDWSKPIIDCNANLGSDSLQRVEVPQMDGNTLSFYQSKIDEIKFVTGNTDAANGEIPSGITSGVALAAVYEHSGKRSKDSNKASYRAMKQLYLMMVELMRQFYTMDRQFRIVGEDGMVSYMHYTNAGLMMRTQMTPYGMTYRLPLFDVDAHVQRENAYTRMALNDLATQFYQMGLFNPMAAPQALSMLRMMEFTGKDKIVRMIQQNFMQTMAQMGGMAPSGAPAGPQQGQPGQQGTPKSSPVEDDKTEPKSQRNDAAHTPATDRMEQRINNAVRP